MPEVLLKKDISLANIPAFPAVVLRVLDIASQDNPDFDLLVREITSDATLSAQVLRLANSPLFGCATQISTVQRAVVTLGTAQVQSLVMSVATANYSRAALRTEAMQKCWRHTLATAILSREIARAACMPREQAYSLGLLHDIGRLGLLVAWPDDYNRILQEADRESVLLLDLEKQLFTMDHCEVGRRLVEQWKLPPEFLVVAARHHDAPAGATEFDGLRVVSIACRMADALGYWVAKPLRPELLEAILLEWPADMRERFPADPDALKQLVESSVTGGGEALNQPAPDYMQSPGVGVPLEERRPVEDREVVTSAGASSIMWDFAIVVTTILTFMAVMIAMHYYWT